MHWGWGEERREKLNRALRLRNGGVRSTNEGLCPRHPTAEILEPRDK